MFRINVSVPQFIRNYKVGMAYQDLRKTLDWRNQHGDKRPCFQSLLSGGPWWLGRGRTTQTYMDDRFLEQLSHNQALSFSSCMYRISIHNLLIFMKNVNVDPRRLRDCWFISNFKHCLKGKKKRAHRLPSVVTHVEDSQIESIMYKRNLNESHTQRDLNEFEWIPQAVELCCSLGIIWEVSLLWNKPLCAPPSH